jgi:hypothetical protein
MLADVSALKVSLGSIENDWKIREDALTILLQSLNNPSDTPTLLEFTGTIPELIAYQFADLRSGIVKLASEVVSAYVRAIGETADASAVAFADRLLAEPAFYKALGSGNKVIGKHAQNAMRALVAHHCLTLDILKRIYAMQKANKITFIRENVAESFVTFINGAVLPSKKLLGSNQSVGLPVDAETTRDFGAPVLGLGKTVSQPMQIESDLPPAPPKGLGKTGGSEVDMLFWTQQIKEENFDFLKSVCETFIRDLSPHVRNSGKEIKSKIAKIQEVFLSRQETNASTFSNELMEEHEVLDRLDGVDSAMVIESTNTKEPASKTGGVSAFYSRNSLTKNLPLEEKILRLLKTDSKTVKDQTEELEKLILSTQATLVFTFDQYIEILTAFNVAKNLNFKATLGRILTRADISHFQFAILDHLLKEKLTKRTGFGAVAKYIVDRVSFEALLNMLITRSYEELIGMANKHFCPRKLHKAVARHEVEAQDIASAIQRNYTKAETAGIPNVGQFRVQNMAFLTKIFADPETASLFRAVEWAPSFLEKMREAGIEVGQIKTNPEVSEAGTFSLREVAAHLSHATTEAQLVTQLSDVLSATTLNDLQKTEFTQLMLGLLARKTAQASPAPLDPHLTESVRSCLQVLTGTRAPKATVLSYLVIWAACPASLTPEWVKFLYSLVTDGLNNTSAETVQAAAESFVVLGNLCALSVGGLLESLAAFSEDSTAVSFCDALQKICWGLQHSIEAPAFILQFNLGFQTFVMAMTRMIDSQDPHLQTVAATTIAGVNKFANPISYAAFVGSLGAEMQHKVTLSGLN